MSVRSTNGSAPPTPRLNHALDVSSVLSNPLKKRNSEVEALRKSLEYTGQKLKEAEQTIMEMRTEMRERLETSNQTAYEYGVMTYRAQQAEKKIMEMRTEMREKLKLSNETAIELVKMTHRLQEATDQIKDMEDEYGEWGYTYNVYTGKKPKEKPKEKPPAFG